jgi:hypothetical protein
MVMKREVSRFRGCPVTRGPPLIRQAPGYLGGGLALGSRWGTSLPGTLTLFKFRLPPTKDWMCLGLDTHTQYFGFGLAPAPLSAPAEYLVVPHCTDWDLLLRHVCTFEVD